MKIKVCPNCGKHNPESAWSCENCGTTLSLKTLIDIDLEKKVDKRNSTFTHHFLIQTSSEISYETKYKLLNALMDNIAESNPEYKNSKIGAAKFIVGADENQATGNFKYLLNENDVTPSSDDVIMNFKGEDTDTSGTRYQWHMIILFIPKSNDADVKKSNSETLDSFLKWRSIFFSTTNTLAEVADDQPNSVYGVIMDVGLSDDFTISITAFSTGMSSLITTIGGGVIDLSIDEFITQQAKHIVTLAQSLIKTAHSIKSQNLPKSENAYFYFLTTSGLMLSETTIEEMSAQDHPFHEIFERFTDIKTRSEELTTAYKRKH